MVSKYGRYGPYSHLHVQLLVVYRVFIIVLCKVKKRFFLDSYLMPFKTNNHITFEIFNFLTCRLFL